MLTGQALCFDHVKLLRFQRCGGLVAEYAKIEIQHNILDQWHYNKTITITIKLLFIKATLGR